MYPWGSVQRPIIVRVNSKERAQKVTQICNQHGMHYIMGIEPDEDLTDLQKALREKLMPGNPYSECPCGSKQKFKFCCMPKVRSFDIYEYIERFEVADKKLQG